MKVKFIKSVFLVLSTSLAANIAQAKSSFPAHFSCTDLNGVVFEGTIPEEPKLSPAIGEEQIGIFTLNGSSVTGTYSYEPNCIRSRADQIICSDPDTILFDFRLDVQLPNGMKGSKFHGKVTVYDFTTSRLHIREIESTPFGDSWYDNGTCTWNWN